MQYATNVHLYGVSSAPLNDGLDKHLNRSFLIIPVIVYMRTY